MRRLLIIPAAILFTLGWMLKILGWFLGPSRSEVKQLAEKPGQAKPPRRTKRLPKTKIECAYCGSHSSSKGNCTSCGGSVLK